ncbi:MULTISPECIES: hypothetical protein [unclassified Roseivivax]|uniref:hypothetical protein n=1 Tax=Roseivivax sp. GX 12232 TaxID=2900547 RepID=UPI001E5BA4FA|nr:hypothetical protein [Roseivivax sp. GX 12232]MCE0507077.1 hypothetical protein [Roseivivax sp. GX 12232]
MLFTILATALLGFSCYYVVRHATLVSSDVAATLRALLSNLLAPEQAASRIALAVLTALMLGLTFL